MCVRADLSSAGLWYCALLYFYVAWLKSALWMCSPRGAALAFIADWMWNRSRVCPDTVYSSFAGTHLTYSYWQQSGWGQASLLTVVTTPSVGVCVFDEITLLGKTLHRFSSSACAMVKLPLLLDKGIICSAMFRSVLFFFFFRRLLLIVPVNTDLEYVSMSLFVFSLRCPGVYLVYVLSSSSNISRLVSQKASKKSVCAQHYTQRTVLLCIKHVAPAVLCHQTASVPRSLSGCLYISFSMMVFMLCVQCQREWICVWGHLVSQLEPGRNPVGPGSTAPARLKHWC